MKVMIAEEETPYREELSFLLSQEEDVEICAEVSGGEELLRLSDELRPDAVFLEPCMQDSEGIRAARMLAGKAGGPILVFVTSAEQYAVEAFSLHAADYIVKPYDRTRLAAAVQRVRERLKRNDDAARGKPMQYLLVNNGEKIIVLHPESIVAIIKEEKFVAIHTVEGKCHSSKATLQELEEKLKAFPFFRTHRSYLINLTYIEELTPWFNGAYNLKMKAATDLKVPVSRDAAKELFKRLGGE